MTATEKVEALTTAANEVTGESATNLTDAVQDLVDGYGGGDLPETYILLSDYNNNGSPKKAEIKGVTMLLSYCFYGYSGLTEITIPDGVTSLGTSCFYDCRGLTSITIPDGVTGLGSKCFYGCIGLTSITIPDGVTGLASECFRGCIGLTSITLKSTTKYTYPSNFLLGTTALQHIYVPSDLVDSYKAASGWSAFADKIEAIPTT